MVQYPDESDKRKNDWILKIMEHDSSRQVGLETKQIRWRHVNS